MLIQFPSWSVIFLVPLLPSAALAKFYESLNLFLLPNVKVDRAEVVAEGSFPPRAAMLTARGDIRTYRICAACLFVLSSLSSVALF
jgi:hypothetical protein